MRRGPIVALMGAALLASVTTPAPAYPRPGSTDRVSVSSEGQEANTHSFDPAISADGRYVAFHSSASNLVPGDTNGLPDVFVHDRETGVTERVSVASDGTQGNHFSVLPALRADALSADGRYVAFQSFASNLVPGDTNGTWDVFVHDRETGVTERVSVASDGTEGDHPSVSPASMTPVISADGRYVAFESLASNLAPGGTGAAHFQVFVHDRATGTTERLSVALDGAEGNGDSTRPALSADGRHVAFDSTATDLVPGDTDPDNRRAHVFVHDRETGVTERVSVASDGAEGNGGSFAPAISADGRVVAFYGYASNLVPVVTNATFDVFVHDRETGVTERVSVASDGTEGNGFSGIPAISADGRYVAFPSSASNLVPGDTNASGDVFVHDREMGVTERVSVASDGAEGNRLSAFRALSGDGRYVAFGSLASNLVPGDTNDVRDVFVRDRGPAAGVGGLTVSGDADQLTVSGWATFSGAAVSSAEDPGDDGVGPLGAEITGASVTHRFEEEDLLLRLHLASLPEGGHPGIVYSWAFTSGGVTYRVRALRAAATVTPPTADPYFGLFACDLVCTETARLSGGMGTTGAEVRMSVPLEVLGVEEGATLTDIEASTALGEASPGPLVALDDVALPDATIPATQVSVGIAPADTPEEEVAFTTLAELVEGRFSGTMDVSSLPAGEYRVWARGCLGEACGARSAEVTL